MTDKEILEDLEKIKKDLNQLANLIYLSDDFNTDSLENIEEAIRYIRKAQIALNKEV